MEKLSLNKEELQKKVEVNYRCLYKKNDDDVFSTIQVLATKNKLVFMSNNESGIIKSYLPIQRDGENIEISVNGSNLFSAVKSLKSESAELIFDKEKMVVKGGRRKFELKHKSTSNIYKGEEPTLEKVDVDNFIRIIENSGFCLSTDKMTPILQCVWFGSDKTMAGDGWRYVTMNIKTPIRNMAISAKMLSEMLTILKSYEDAKPELKYSQSADQKHAVFRIGDDYYFSVNLLEERYPKHMADNFSDYKNKIVCNTQDFLDVVQNFSSILDENYKVLNIEIGDKVKMYINTASCNGEDEIDVISKEEITSTSIKCNYRFMLDALQQIKGKENFTMEISDDKKVCNIKTDDADFVHPICLMTSS